MVFAGIKAAMEKANEDTTLDGAGAAIASVCAPVSSTLDTSMRQSNTATVSLTVAVDTAALTEPTKQNKTDALHPSLFSGGGYKDLRNSFTIEQFSRCREKMLNIALRRGFSLEGAEDIVQDAVVKTLAYQGEITDSVERFLLRTTSNLTINAIKRSAIERRIMVGGGRLGLDLESFENALAKKVQSPLRRILEKEACDRIDHAIAALSDVDQARIRLTMNGEPQQTSAEKLGVKVITFKGQLFEARKRLIEICQRLGLFEPAAT